MKKPSRTDMLVPHILGWLRGARAEHHARHPGFEGLGSESVRKRMERQCDAGYLAGASLPVGQKLFHLSLKGAKLVGAPTRFASSPSTNIAVEMLAVSQLTFCSNPATFLKDRELQEVLDGLAKQTESAQSDENLLPTTGRFYIRHSSGKTENSNALLQFMLAELRPAEQLAKRANTLCPKLLRVPVLSALHSMGLFSIAIVVPSEGVKATLEKMALPTNTTIWVVPEIQDVIK